MTIGRDNLKNSNKSNFATYNTVAELVAAPASRFSNGAEILLRGYYAAGDFGETLSLIVESAAAGVNSFTLTDGRFANLYAKKAHLKYFGVVGNGVTDDTVALQTALASNATFLTGDEDMVVLAGHVDWTNTKTLDMRGGAIKAATSLDTAYSQSISITSSNNVIRNTVFDGNGLVLTTNAPVDGNESYWYLASPSVNSGSNNVFDSCTFKDYRGSQLRVTGTAKSTTVRNCRFLNENSLATRYGVLFRDPTAETGDNVVVDNYFYMTSGINCMKYVPNFSDRTQDIPQKRNKICRNTIIGGFINNAGIQAIIDSNIIDAKHRQQYWAGAFAGPQLVFGITLDNGYGCTVTNNRIRGIREFGIEITTDGQTYADPSDGESFICSNNFVYCDDPDSATYPNTKGISYRSHGGLHINGVISNNSIIRARLDVAGKGGTNDLSDDTQFCKNLIVSHNNISIGPNDTASPITGTMLKDCVFSSNNVDCSVNPSIMHSITKSKNVSITGGIGVGCTAVVRNEGFEFVGNPTVDDLPGEITIRGVELKGDNVLSTILEGGEVSGYSSRIYAYDCITPYKQSPYLGVSNYITSGWTSALVGSGTLTQGPAGIVLDLGATINSSVQARLGLGRAIRPRCPVYGVATGFELARQALYSVTMENLSLLNSSTFKFLRIIYGKQTTTGIDAVTLLSSGTLTIGQTYWIRSYVAGDDFTNVGAASNATGIQFIATGTTPTTWANSSSLVEGINSSDSNLFGWEIRKGTEIYGFYFDGTNSVYTPKIADITSPVDLRKYLTICTGAGAFNTLYFMVNAREAGEKSVQWINGIGDVDASGFGISLEYSAAGGTSTGTATLSDISIIDMTN